VKGDKGIIFENFVALSLLKSLVAENDYQGKSKSLHYLRTKNQQEVDFAISDDDNVIFRDVNNNPPSSFDKIFQHITIGTEVILGKNLNLRAGYNHLIRKALKAEQVGGAGGFTFGLYFQTKKFSLAYSSAIYQAGGFAHFITLGSNLKEFVKKKS
jgi:hypothetical protein